MTKEPYIEVNGQTVYAIVDGMGPIKPTGIQILEENGIKDLDPKAWYSQQDWLNAFKLISDKIGPHTLFSIGKKIPENARFPAEIDDIEKALASIDVAYHMNHRIDGEPMFNPKDGSMKEGIGHYAYKKIGDSEVEIKCDNPYPCQFDQGIITAMANRFKPEYSLGVRVEHDSTKGCREKDHKDCHYIIKW
ncbi:hypothetical protein KKC60_00795 [Patescibacteria group bacterium]|nr:hypothetical protein [Patescibacteria group bacterium]